MNLGLFDTSRFGRDRRRSCLPPECSVWPIIGLGLPLILKQRCRQARRGAAGGARLVSAGGVCDTAAMFILVHITLFNSSRRGRR